MSGTVVAICVGIRVSTCVSENRRARDAELGDDTVMTRDNEARQATHIIENIFHGVIDGTCVVNNIIWKKSMILRFRACKGPFHFFSDHLFIIIGLM